MPKEKKPDWMEIVRDEDFPILQWFYQFLLHDIFKGIGSDRQQIKWQQWYKDSDFSSWLSWYEQPLSVLNTLTEKVIGMPIPSPPFKPKEARDIFIEFLKRLKELVEKEFEINEVREIAQYVVPALMQFRLQLFVGLNQICSVVQFHETVTELMDKSKRGDSETILKLIKLDKTFIEFEPIKKRIRLATLFHQTWFLDDLSSAIKSDFFKYGLDKRIDDLAIYIFWEIGFSNAPLKIFNEFLWEVGITKYVTENALGKHLERIGLTKYTRKHQK